MKTTSTMVNLDSLRQLIDNCQIVDNPDTPVTGTMTGLMQLVLQRFLTMAMSNDGELDIDHLNTKIEIQERNLDILKAMRDMATNPALTAALSEVFEELSSTGIADYIEQPTNITIINDSTLVIKHTVASDFIVTNVGKL